MSTEEARAHLRRILGDIPLEAATQTVVYYAEKYAEGMTCMKKRVAAELAIERVKQSLSRTSG